MRKFIDIVESASRPNVSAMEAFDEWRDANGISSFTVVLRTGYLLPDDLYIEGIHISAQDKGSGRGRAIMDKLIELSEQYSIPLTLEASEESEDSDWIQGWYKRNGFQYSDEGYGDYGPYMERHPNT